MLSMLLLAATITVTSFISGVFGMAGGMVLLLALLASGLDIPTAMALHGVAQATGNLWRILTWRRWVNWTVIGYFAAGTIVSLALIGMFRFEPDRALVLIMLGMMPFAALLVPKGWFPQADRPVGGCLCGLLSMAVTLVAGVAGPLLDTFFVRTSFDRKTIVATKAGCQLLGNGAKTAYFTGLSGLAALSDSSLLLVALVFPVAGTILSKFVLEWITEVSFHRYTRIVICVIGLSSIVSGILELLNNNNQ